MSSVSGATVESKVKRVRMFFDQASDEQFLVLAEVFAPTGSGALSAFQLATYKHEDRFLEHVVAANLTTADTSQIASIVLLTVADPYRAKNWVELDLNPDQRLALGLEKHVAGKTLSLDASFDLDGLELPFGFKDDISQLHNFLMKAPSAFVMVSGPDHRFTFLNERFLALIGEDSAQSVMKKPFREVLPDLEGQAFSKLLDEVYRTGEAHIGIETLAHMRRKGFSGSEDRYFDFICYPYKDRLDKVCGVMIQATDVTERVESKAVTQDREDQVFRQWAELDSIYRAAPIAMALSDAKSFRLLRLNKRQAELMGATVHDL